MAILGEEEHQKEKSPIDDDLPTNGEDDEDFEDGDDEEDEEEEEEIMGIDSKRRLEKAKMENLFRRISTESVPLRVHDVLIKGNKKTKDYLIEAEIEGIKDATTIQEILQATTIASARLQRLDIFDSVNITLESGPPELPGTTNVVVQVVEAENPLSGNIGVFSKPEDVSFAFMSIDMWWPDLIGLDSVLWHRANKLNTNFTVISRKMKQEAMTWSLEGSVKLKNLFGHGDLWDGSLAYGLSQSSEVSVGVNLPRFKGMTTPLVARAFLLSQDWLNSSSYKERSVGMSLGLISTKKHNLAYNLSWRTLTDPTQMASKSIRRQLGHGLFSSLKYTYTLDRRNSPLRPTRGYAFFSTSQIGGLLPDHRSLRFIRQEFDLRYAVPLGFARSAINFGVSCGVTFPWGNGFLNKPSFLPERFFLGGNSSPVCNLGGPLALLGFKSRGLGPTEPRRAIKDNEGSETSAGRDYLGGDLAVTAFADLSFDLPVKVLRDAGIHGHVFACAGNLAKLSENAFRDLSFQKFRESFRSSAGVGIIVPTKLFRMEVNYCYIVKQQEHDRGKTGVQFCFSSPL